jgi:hypothetical protein
MHLEFTAGHELQELQELQELTSPTACSAAGGGAAWTAEQTAVLLERALTISAGGALAIRPGVAVQATAAGSLRVDGGLFAAGELGRPVRFTARQLSGACGRWGGVVVGAGAHGLLLQHVAISGAAPAVQISGGSGGWQGPGGVELLLASCIFEVPACAGGGCAASAVAVQASTSRFSLVVSACAFGALQLDGGPPAVQSAQPLPAITVGDVMTAAVRVRGSIFTAAATAGHDAIDSFLSLAGDAVVEGNLFVLLQPTAGTASPGDRPDQLSDGNVLCSGWPVCRVFKHFVGEYIRGCLMLLNVWSAKCLNWWSTVTSAHVPRQVTAATCSRPTRVASPASAPTMPLAGGGGAACVDDNERVRAVLPAFKDCADAMAQLLPSGSRAAACQASVGSAPTLRSLCPSTCHACARDADAPPAVSAVGSGTVDYPGLASAATATKGVGLVINEVVAGQNDSGGRTVGVRDTSGSLADYIEIYNPTATEISIHGHIVMLAASPAAGADASAKPTCDNDKRWVIGGGASTLATSSGGLFSIPPGGFLLLFADDDRWQGFQHAPFKLPSAGSTLWLYSPDGRLLDQLAYPALETNHAYGRRLDGAGGPALLPGITPGYSNLLGAVAQPSPLTVACRVAEAASVSSRVAAAGASLAGVSAPYDGPLSCLPQGENGRNSEPPPPSPVGDCRMLAAAAAMRAELRSPSPRGPPPPPPPRDGTPGACSDIRNWPDVDNGVVCGGCTLLVDQMASRYGGLCSNYCRTIGRECVGAWEERDDTCAVESVGECDPGLTIQNPYPYPGSEHSSLELVLSRGIARAGATARLGALQMRSASALPIQYLPPRRRRRRRRRRPRLDVRIQLGRA